MVQLNGMQPQGRLTCPFSLIYFTFDPPFVLRQALHDTFAAFGNVLSCKVAVDESGASRGYGFVHYETADAANAAIGAVNGMLLNDRKVFVGHHVSKKVCASTVFDP